MPDADLAVRQTSREAQVVESPNKINFAPPSYSTVLIIRQPPSRILEEMVVTNRRPAYLNTF